jgi:hypothetical protein
MSNTFNKRLDVVFRSKGVAQASWNTAQDVKVMRTCTCMLRKVTLSALKAYTDVSQAGLILRKFNMQRNFAKTC